MGEIGHSDRDQPGCLDGEVQGDGGRMGVPEEGGRGASRKSRERLGPGGRSPGQVLPGAPGPMPAFGVEQPGIFGMAGGVGEQRLRKGRQAVAFFMTVVIFFSITGFIMLAGGPRWARPTSRPSSRAIVALAPGPVRCITSPSHFHLSIPPGNSSFSPASSAERISSMDVFAVGTSMVRSLMRGTLPQRAC